MKTKVIQLLARADMGGGPRHVEYILDAIKNEADFFVGCPEDKPFVDTYRDLLGAEKVTIIPHRKLSLSAFFSLLRYVKKSDISIIHVHGKGASVYGKLLKIFRPKSKLIYTSHGIHVDGYSALQRFIFVSYEFLTSFLIDHVIYVSDSERLKAKVNKLYLRNQFSVIQNGVPVFNKADGNNWTGLKESLFKHPDRKTVITVSRFDPQKNMEETMEVASLLPMYNFLWLGDGETQPAIIDQIKQKGISNINVLGVKTNVNDFLSISDLYLSTSRGEGMPLALLEAMAAGVPILASNVTGNRDVINQHTGLLYELGDVQEAAQKADDMLQNQRFDKAGLKNYFEAHYSVNVMAAGILKIYKSFSL